MRIGSGWIVAHHESAFRRVFDKKEIGEEVLDLEVRIRGSLGSPAALYVQLLVHIPLTSATEEKEPRRYRPQTGDLEIAEWWFVAAGNNAQSLRSGTQQTADTVIMRFMSDYLKGERE